MRKQTMIATALLLCPLALPAQQGDTWNWSGNVRSGQSLEIKGVNGGINAVLGTGSQIKVTAVKREGDRGDAADVKLELVEHAAGVTICAVYPAPRGRAPNECQPGKKGRSSVNNNDVKVEFTVELPAGTALVARTVNGAVNASGLRSDVEIYTVNGDVEVATTGTASAETVNGTIDAALGGGMGQRDLAFETVNGSITVEFAGDLNANVHASTVNGGIETDWPLTVRGRFGPKSVTGTIGSGGRSLDLTTVNGSIEIRKRS